MLRGHSKAKEYLLLRSFDNLTELREVALLDKVSGTVREGEVGGIHALHLLGSLEIAVDRVEECVKVPRSISVTIFLSSGIRVRTFCLLHDAANSDPY